MDELQIQHLNKLKRIHQKRLQVLEVQAAKFGLIATPPHVLIEIEELKNKINGLEAQLVSLAINKKGSALNKQENTINLPDLRLNIEKHFNVDELRTLCFDLGIESENFPQYKEGFSRELINHCVRNGKILELIDYCLQERSHVTW